jgi:hypothetical protein
MNTCSLTGCTRDHTPSHQHFLQLLSSEGWEAPGPGLCQWQEVTLCLAFPTGPYLPKGHSELCAQGKGLPFHKTKLSPFNLSMTHLGLLLSGTENDQMRPGVRRISSFFH